MKNKPHLLFFISGMIFLVITCVIFKARAQIKTHYDTSYGAVEYYTMEDTKHFTINVMPAVKIDSMWPTTNGRRVTKTISILVRDDSENVYQLNADKYYHFIPYHQFQTTMLK